MREACIILPTLPRPTEDPGQGIENHYLINRGAKVRDDLITKLVDAFGGCTYTVNGTGYWRAPDGTIHHESVWLFTVAVPWSEQARYKLRTFATDAARALNQLAVYIREHDGEVLIIPIPERT